MDQIESIQEIQIFPCFLSGLKAFSGSFPVVSEVGASMSVAYKLNHEVVNTSFDCIALDVDFLNRNTFGDRALRGEIVGLFLAQLDGVQRSLTSPVNQLAWQFLTHTLKGAASAVGAIGIATTADRWGKSPAPTSSEQRNIVQMQLRQLILDFKQATQKL
jgi:hypothetical protein